jgi:hypothetical protein
MACSSRCKLLQLSGVCISSLWIKWMKQISSLGKFQSLNIDLLSLSETYLIKTYMVGLQSSQNDFIS